MDFDANAPRLRTNLPRWPDVPGRYSSPGEGRRKPRERHHTSRSSFDDALSLFAPRRCSTANNINAGNACAHVRLNLSDDARYTTLTIVMPCMTSTVHGVATPRFNFGSIWIQFARASHGWISSLLLPPPPRRVSLLRLAKREDAKGIWRWHSCNPL